jgi:hypothetical protein
MRVQQRVQRLVRHMELWGAKLPVQSLEVE